MKVRIRGKEYDAVDQNTAAPLHMIEAQQQAKRPGEDGLPLIDGGLGMSAISRGERAMRAYRNAVKRYRKATEAREAGEDVEVPDEPETPDEAAVMFGLQVFLTLRAAGEKVTLRDALLVPLAAVEQIDEPDDQGEAPDPTTAGEAAPASPETPGSDVPATAQPLTT